MPLQTHALRYELVAATPKPLKRVEGLGLALELIEV